MAREEGRRERGPGMGLDLVRAHHQPQGGQSQGTSGQRDLGTDGWTRGGRVRCILPLQELAQLLVVQRLPGERERQRETESG